MDVKLSDLPVHVQQKIPISIRSASDIYDIKNLPPKIQELIRQYFKKIVQINYNEAIDLRPSVSKYADISVIKSVKETVIEYLKNYLYTLPGSYPFDPLFGCKLKQHLQTKDTQLRRLLICDEINKIANVLSSDLKMPIKIKNISITPISSALRTSISCKIELSIPGEDNFPIEIQTIMGE